jgi:acetyl-CoA acetyltransferase
MSQEVVIVGGARTPMCEYVGTPGYGKFKDVSAIDLAVHASKAVLAPQGLDFARDLLVHCSQEMSHLAGFLPELYAACRDGA